MSRPEQDGIIEDLLRRSRISPGPLGGEKCGDPELLAAYAEGGLAGAERDHFETHLASCTDCREAVARLVRLTPQVGQVSNLPARARWMFRFAPALAGVVLVGSLAWYEKDRVFEKQDVPKAQTRAMEPSKPTTVPPPAAADAVSRVQPQARFRVQEEAKPARQAGAPENARDLEEERAKNPVAAKDKKEFAPSPFLEKQQAPEPNKAATNQQVINQLPSPRVNQEQLQMAPQQRADQSAKAKALPMELADRLERAAPSASIVSSVSGFAKKAVSAPPGKGTVIARRDLDAQHIWALMDSGLLYYTSDGGQAWRLVRTPEPAQSLAFQDEKTGEITGRSGVVYKTSDAGKTWEKKE